MKRRRKRTKSEPKGDYEIGYCRPPKATQFQPGQSGNPTGPGKRPRSIGAAADKALASKVAVVDQHGRRRSFRAEDLIMRRFRDAALNGDVKAAAFLADRAERYRSSQPETTQAPELSPQDIEILDSFFARDARGRKRKPSTRRKPPARQKPRGEEPASDVRPA
jgi:Family of unknown function (DUF5681)